MKGTYLLLLRLDAPLVQLQIGRLGCFDFAPGYYLYLGSAFGSGGVRARLSRHEQREKPRPHWHIDYLRPHTHLCESWSVSAGTQRLEQPWCRVLRTSGVWSAPVPGFGASDSRCNTHLLYSPAIPTISRISQSLFVCLASAHPDVQKLTLAIHRYPMCP